MVYNGKSIYKWVINVITRGTPILGTLLNILRTLDILPSKSNSWKECVWLITTKRTTKPKSLFSFEVEVRGEMSHMSVLGFACLPIAASLGSQIFGVVYIVQFLPHLLGNYMIYHDMISYAQIGTLWTFISFWPLDAI